MQNKTKAAKELWDVLSAYQGPNFRARNEAAFLDALSEWLTNHFGNVNAAQQINIIRTTKYGSIK